MKTKYNSYAFYGYTTRRGKSVYNMFLTSKEKYVCRTVLLLACMGRQLFFHIVSFFGLYKDIRCVESPRVADISRVVNVFRRRCAPSKQDCEEIKYWPSSCKQNAVLSRSIAFWKCIYDDRCWRNPAIAIHKISVSSTHTLFSTRDGRLYGFGSNSHGELGIGDCRARAKAVQIPISYNVDNVACGFHFSIISFQENCFVAQAVLGVCGKNTTFQLGNNRSSIYMGEKHFSSHMAMSFTLVFIDTSAVVIQIACGWSHSLVLLSNGVVMGTGLGYLGRLGFGSDCDVKKFSQIPFPSENIIEIGAGDMYSIARSSQCVYTFGNGIRTPTEIECDIDIDCLYAGEEQSFMIGGDFKTEIRSFGNKECIDKLMTQMR